MNDENILIRALEPEDLEYLYKWENDMDLWEVSDTLTPFSHFTLKNTLKMPIRIFTPPSNCGS